MSCRATWALVLTLCLGACAVGPDFKRPAAPAAPGYGPAQPPGATAASDVAGGAAQRFVAGLDIPREWWTLFQSPKLSEMVGDALKANPNATAAEAALRQAHELYLAQRASLFPVVQGGFSATRAKDPFGSIAPPTVSPNPVYSLYTAQLNLTYVPDVFGGVRRAIEASKAQEDATRFQLEAVYLTLSSNVVVTAMQEAALRGQIAVTERQLQVQHDLTETVRKQRALGTASELDLLAQQSAEAQTAQTLPPLQKQLGLTRDALTALLGRLPSEEPEARFNLEDLTLPAELPVSLPSRLIEQRPDVRQAEENLHAASAGVGIAIANRLPQFAITGSYGSSALKFSDLFKSGTGFWDVGGSVLQTIFDGGALKHRSKAAEAALEQAAAQYKATVITACQNVADSLRALQSDADALKASFESARAARAAFELAQRQLKLGTVSLVVVLNAELTYRQAELALVQAQANRYSDTAGLFQALGGGWWHQPEEARDERSGIAGK
jgi:NodT family efflux transporter outer membrane factor (OMF) lipoprotein